MLDDNWSFNALAGTVNGLYMTELIRRRGLWWAADKVELATAARVAWWNEQRLHSACADIPPAEFEAAYHQAPTGDHRARLKSHHPGLPRA